MSEDVRVTFSKAGDRELLSVFRSISAAAEQMQTAQKGAAAAARRAGSQTAQAWSAAGRPMSATERLAMRVAASQERAARRAAAAANKGATEQANAAKRAANAQIREGNRAHQAEVRRQLALLRVERRARMNRELNEKRHQMRIQRFREGRQSTLGMSVRAGMDRLGGGIGSRVVGGLVRGVAGLGLAGAAAVGFGVREGIQLDDASRRLARKGGGGVTGTQLRREFEQQALATPGVKAADLAAASERFVGKTGNLDAARQFTKVFAEISLATGAAAEDIGDAAADLFEKFDIKTMEDMNAALSTLAVQGKRGSFELEDAAAQFPKLAAAAQSFGLGKGVKSLSVLGGLTQIARSATGSPEQAASSVEAMFRQLTAQSPALKRAGVNVFDKQGKARDVRDVLTETISKVGGTDVEKKKVELQKIFGEEGIRALRPLIATYTEALAQGKDGVAALTAQFDKAIDSTGAVEEIQRDLADAQRDTGAQWTAVWEQFKAGLGERVVPMAMEGLQRLAEWIGRTDFSAFESGLVVATQALGAFVSFLEGIGLFKRKTVGGTEGKIKTSELKTAAAEKGIEAGALTEKRGDLQTELATGQDIRTGAKLSKDELAQRQLELSAVQRQETSATVAASYGRMGVIGRRGVEQIETVGGFNYKNSFAQSQLSRVGMGSDTEIAQGGLDTKMAQAGSAFDAAFQRVANQLEGKGTEAGTGIAAAGEALVTAIEEVANRVNAKASVFSPT